MTVEGIEAEKAKDAAKVAVKFDTAKAIRGLLDKAREQYGPDDWDDEELENTILDLVSGDDN